MIPDQAKPVVQKLTWRAYLILALLLIGNASTSSVITIMGYNIVSVLGKGPWAFTVYTVFVTVSSVGIMRWFGSLIDNGADVRQLLFASVVCFCCAAILLNIGVSYVWLVVLVAPLFALANSSLSVMYTFGRLYAEREQLDVPQFNAFLRMNTSAGWIIGPSISFGILGMWGIKASFAASLALGLLWICVWAIAIPEGFRHSADESVDPNKSADVSLRLRIAAVACVFFAATNAMFIASMPIYLIDEVGLPAFTPGMAFAIKCSVELPAIFWSVRLAARIGDRTVLMISALLAVLVMLLMTTVSSVPMLAAYAAIEGLYYGLFAGTVVGYMQSFADGRMGRATSIYVSSLFVGGMFGAISVGTVASFYDFKGGVYLSAITACLALVVVYFLKSEKTQKLT